MEFADQALAKFLQTAPELGPMVLNFQEITEDVGSDSVEVGVFILKTGLGICYAPVIGSAGTVYPIDSLFIEGESRFIPITQSYIKMLSTSGMSLGRSTTIPSSVPRSVDVSAMINPPRTGKYVYASQSRLVEFLASMGDSVKAELMEKLASEGSLYQSLDKMFGLKSILEVLNTRSGSDSGPSATNTTATSTPNLNPRTDISVLTTPQEIANLTDEHAKKEYLESGFVVSGTPSTSRAAITINQTQESKFAAVFPGINGGNDFTAVEKTGGTRSVFVPKYHKLNPVDGDSVVSVLENGDYIRGSFIAKGDPAPVSQVLSWYIDSVGPRLLRDCAKDDLVLIFTQSGETFGPFEIEQLTITPAGAEAKVYSQGSRHTDRIRKVIAAKNLVEDVNLIGDTLFIRYSSVVVGIGANKTHEFETNVNNAQKFRDFSLTKMLGSSIDIRHDGVEFSIDGKYFGGFPNALKVLVERENIEPVTAGSFLKQAQVETFVKVFLTKKADQGGTPVEIPNYGVRAEDGGEMGPMGKFVPAVGDAASTGDGQVVEATIISQLLQTPDMFEVIREYLPELKGALDKLGRNLLLSRVKIDQLSAIMDSDSVFSLIARTKNVYRQLGDTILKLEQYSNTAASFEPPDGARVSNGV